LGKECLGGRSVSDHVWPLEEITGLMD
jgi:hypothetical protein